ncbi:MAG: PEP-CTERM sorting domain-containing protein [Akkermansiaceae bacterium]|nr:PEP-CTERM sorting domain-containing protein [Akkermansiaceae bacterium]
MKKYVIICALCSSLGNAAIVKSSSLLNIDGSVPDTLILAVAGDTLSFGFASSGVFPLSDTQVSTFASAQDVNSLISAFDGFIGSDDFQTGVDFLFGTGDISGAYAFQSTSFDPTSVIGQSLYTFIGNGADLVSSTEFGLYKHSNTLVADPAPPALENTVDLLLDGGELLIGLATTVQSTDPNLGTNDTTVMAVQLAVAVPEPSTLLLSALGVLALLRRKR